MANGSDTSPGKKNRLSELFDIIRGHKITAVTVIGFGAIATGYLSGLGEYFLDITRSNAGNVVRSLDEWVNGPIIIDQPLNYSSSRVDFPFRSASFCFDYVSEWVEKHRYITNEVANNPNFKYGEYTKNGKYFSVECNALPDQAISFATIYTASVDIDDIITSFSNESIKLRPPIQEMSKENSSSWMLASYDSILFRTKIVNDKIDAVEQYFKVNITPYLSKIGYQNTSCGSNSCSYQMPGNRLTVTLPANADRTASRYELLWFFSGQRVWNQWGMGYRQAKKIVEDYPYPLVYTDSYIDWR